MNSADKEIRKITRLLLFAPRDNPTVKKAVDPNQMLEHPAPGYGRSTDLNALPGT